MPSIMRKAVEEAIDTYSRTNEDKANYVHMKSISDSLDNKFINELVVILIDLRNINIFLRVKNLKKSWDFLTSKFSLKTLTPPGLPNTVLCLRTELKVFGVPEVLQSLKNCRIIL